MGEVFFKILNMSLTAGWLILAVICFRFIFRKTPKWVICLLWSLVAIRLICPFSIESTFGLLSSTEPIRNTAVVEGKIQDYVPSINSNLPIVKNSVNPMLAESFAYEEDNSVAPLQVVTYVCGIVWGCGMIFMILYAMMSLIRLHLQIREAVPYKDNIMICDAVKSPFILGNIRPRIYLSSGLDENEIEYIVAHEYAHLKRGDHWWKPIGYLLLCVYWFQPLCWIAYILFCKDIELACDEKVIRDMDIEDKKEYSRTLLSCACQREMILACPLAFGEVGVKERVKSVLNYKKPAFWLVLVSIIACFGIAVCFLTTSPRKYQIRVTIPAGGMESFYYSDEEISPKGRRLTLSNGEGLGETDVILKVVECQQENAYEPAYMTPGMPVKMDVEKGAWFKIGVSVQNPTEEDIDVYVEVENVEIRIRSVEEKSESNSEDSSASSNVDIGEILEGICSSPTESSNPDEYIKAHQSEYDTLMNAGEATLRYCIAEFMKGDQTDLRGHVMALVCEELLQSKGKTPLDADAASDGQKWFDAILAHGSNMVESYLSPDDYAIVFGEDADEISDVASIIVINGNNGEEKSFSRTDSNTGFNDLLELYEQLDFVADEEENTRVGYQYRMKLQDVEGNTMQIVTPYKDGFSIDGTFYKYNGADPLDFAAVSLMNYIDLLFYPAHDSVVNIIENTDNTLEYVEELQNKISEAMLNEELPFVTSSSVYENPYRLHIVVNSNAESDLQKLKAFDESGALEIEYRTGNLNELQ